MWGQHKAWVEPLYSHTHTHTHTQDHSHWAYHRLHHFKILSHKWQVATDSQGQLSQVLLLSSSKASVTWGFLWESNKWIQDPVLFPTVVCSSGMDLVTFPWKLKHLSQASFHGISDSELLPCSCWASWKLHSIAIKVLGSSVGVRIIGVFLSAFTDFFCFSWIDKAMMIIIKPRKARQAMQVSTIMWAVSFCSPLGSGRSTDITEVFSHFMSLKASPLATITWCG